MKKITIMNKIISCLVIGSFIFTGNVYSAQDTLRVPLSSNNRLAEAMNEGKLASNEALDSEKTLSIIANKLLSFTRGADGPFLVIIEKQINPKQYWAIKLSRPGLLQTIGYDDGTISDPALRNFVEQFLTNTYKGSKGLSSKKDISIQLKIPEGSDSEAIKNILSQVAETQNSAGEKLASNTGFGEFTLEAKIAKIAKLRREADSAEANGLWVFAYRRLSELEKLNPGEKGVSKRKQTAYEKALSQASPLGKIALERGLIVLYDGIDEEIVEKFHDMQRTDGMSKVTSNGSLIERAIKRRDFDPAISELAKKEASIENIFNNIVAETLIRSGAEAMFEAHQAGEPAGVSIEIESHLDDPVMMMNRADALAKIVGKDDMGEVTINKIPATGKLGSDGIFKGSGIDTIEEAISKGLYPNITLVMCSRGQIRAIAGAIARGLNRRVERLNKVKASEEDIIRELQGFKSYISYFISRVSGELAKNQDIARKISQAETKEEKLALAYRFMDLACAFFVDANEIFVDELRKNGFGDFEKLGCPLTIELDASTGEKELPSDSLVIKALTEGKGAVPIEELSQHMLIKGYKDNYKNWGYYVFRLARPGTADTIPIDLYNALKAGKGNNKIKAITLEEAREALKYAENEFGLNEKVWEDMAAGLITGGVKLFIKAEQTVRLEIAKILTDVAIVKNKYDYAVRELSELHKQLVTLNSQGVIDDSLQKEIEGLLAKVEENRMQKLKWDPKTRETIAGYDMFRDAAEVQLTPEDLLSIIDKHDLFITSIRLSMCREMVLAGIPKEAALNISIGVARSILSGKQCELMAAADLVKGKDDLAIGGALGGTSWIFGITDKNGKLDLVGDGKEKKFKTITGGKDGKDLTVDELVNLIVAGIAEAMEAGKEVFSRQKAVKIGISMPGQTENTIGGWGKTIYESPNLPFKGNTKLAELLERGVKAKTGIDVEVYLKNDGLAALDGERSPLGTFGKNNWDSGLRIILGTGIGGAGFENDRPSEDRVLVEFGHNIVTTRKGFNPLRGSFKYIGDACKESRGFFNDNQLAEKDLRDFEAFAGGENLYALAVNMFSLTTRGEGHRTDLPEATMHAREEYADALQLVQLYGITVGKAVAAMVIGSKSDKRWQDHIILGSTIGERFARGAIVPEVILDQIQKQIELKNLHKPVTWSL